MDESKRFPLHKVGFGTYRAKGNTCREAVCHALKCGYRLIDTAAVYKNHKEVAQGLADSGVSRGDVFITSKLAPKDMQSEETVLAACELMLVELGISQIDCILIHWPGMGGLKPDNPAHKAHRRIAWVALEKFLQTGKTRYIGVSNYEVKHLEEVLSYCSVVPHVNQIEFHPYYRSADILRFCEKHNIQVQGYSSLAQAGAHLFTHPTLLKVTNECKRTPAQVLLAWSLSHNVVVVPKSITNSRIEENWKCQDFTLSDAQVLALNTLACYPRCLDGHTPSTCNCTNPKIKKKVYRGKVCWDPATIA